MKKLIIQNRRGTEQEWIDSNVVPKDGELVVEKGNANSKLKIGDGVTNYEALPYVTSDVERDIEVLNSRVANITVVKDDPTEGNTELADIRVGYDGVTHDTAGDAVRAVGNDLLELSNSLNQFIGADAVNGLEYENNMLYLTANGKQVGSPVGPISGGSGGGGGSGSAITVKLINLTEQGNNFTTTLSSADAKVVLKFKFTSVEDDIPTGDYTCDVDINGRKQTHYFQQKEDGESLDITDFLNNDDNKITIKCTDIYSNYRILTYNIKIVNLVVNSTFNPYQVYTKSESISDIDFRYSVTGAIDKDVYFTLTRQSDNKVIISDKKSLAANTSGVETKYLIPMDNLTHGNYSWRVYAVATVGSTVIESNDLCVDIMVSVDGETQPMISSTYEKSKHVQGELVSIPYTIFDPNNGVIQCPHIRRISYKTANGNIEVYKEEESTIDNESLASWGTRDYPVSSNVYFTIEYSSPMGAATISKTHTVEVVANTLVIEPASDPILFLSSMGRDNKTDPEKWEFGNITTDFAGFNWVSNGWVKDDNGDSCLRINGGAQATINLAPFSASNFDITNSGLTVEFEFAVRDVNNRDTVVINCAGTDGNSKVVTGIIATADQASLSSQKDTISCYYKDEEHIRLAFTIDKDGVDMDGFASCKFMSVYINGVLSKITTYTSNNFTNNQKIVLGDDGCTIDVYAIRVYDRALTHREITNNYLADLPDINLKKTLYSDNNVYSGGNVLLYDEIKDKIPTITFTGIMPTKKGDKKVVKMDFVNPLNSHTRDFSKVYGGPINVLIDVQGTSSQWYVRKNWKIKLKDSKYISKGVNNAPYQHMDDEVAANVFCIKVDYAEATGTHNTQNANFVETLYDTLVPAQEKDDRVRTTITGFPCVIFEKETESSVPVFSSKGNFNFDKGAENAFGFEEDEDGIISTECWEFCNNTADPCRFTGDIARDWSGDFEPRYTPFEDEWDKIEKLLELRDEATDSETQIIDREKFSLEQEAQMLSLMDTVIGDKDAPGTFANLHHWVVSTKNNRTKFRNEFTNYFDLEYATIYYVYTFFALMTDQRAKNMFLTRWSVKKADGTVDTKWYPYFYDNDTCFGINNEGELIFDYYHEDTDEVDKHGPVYNGSDSILWNNFRLEFSKEIKEMYTKLRSNKKLTYDKLVHQFIDMGSDMWSASIYNEDAEYKYVTMARTKNAVGGKVNTENLYQVRGDGEAHLKYFLDNRIKYCDSKWNAGDYPDNFVLMRVNTPRAVLYPTDNVVTQLSGAQKDSVISLCLVGQNYTTQTVTITDINDNVVKTIEVSIGDDKYNDAGFANFTFVVPEDGDYKLSVSEGYTIVSAGGNYPEGATDKQKEEIDARNEMIVRTLSAKAANPAVTLTPFSDMYCGVKYKANGTLLHQRAYKNTPVTLGSAITEVFGDTETAIFGASELSDLGDLSGLYLSVLNIASASKLTRLTVGNHTPGYNNYLFREISVGANPLLQYLDVTNCSRLTDPIDMSKCQNIKEVYAKGTSITGITLPDAGYVTTLHLPATITDLTITNHPTVTDISIGDSGMETQNIASLCIANCGDFDGTAIFESCLSHPTINLSTVKLTGVKWTDYSVSDLQKLYKPKSEGGYGLKGIGAGGKATDTLTITGTCVLNENVSGEVMADLINHFNLTFIMGTDENGNPYSVTSKVTFMDDTGTVVLHTENIRSSSTVNITCDDPVKTGKISAPTRESTNESTFTWNGWSISSSPNRTPQADALLNICGDRVIYPTFSASKRYYPVDYYTGDSLLYRTNVGYNECSYFDASLVDDPSLLTYAEGTGELVPIKTGVASPDIYEFTGNWSPSADLPVTSHVIRYAQFYLDNSELYKVPPEDFTYRTDGSNLTITQYNGVEKDIKIMDTYTIDGTEYTTSAISGDGMGGSGFSNTDITIVDIPDSVKVIDKKAFYNTDDLHTLIIGEGVTTIKDSAFAIGTGLKSSLAEVYYNAKNASLALGSTDGGAYPFSGRNTHDGMTVTIGENVEKIPDGLFLQPSLTANYRGIRTLDMSKATHCESIGNNSFGNNALAEIIWGTGLKSIGVSAFSPNKDIRRLDLPEGLTTISMGAFDSWDALESLYIPSTLTTFTGAFRYCPNLTEIRVHKDSIYENRKNSLVRKSDNTLVLGTYLSDIDDSITTLGERAFSGCSKMTSVTIPSTIKRLPTCVFENCTGLSEVNLPVGLQRMEAQCFYGCTNLSTIEIPNTVQFLGSGALGSTSLVHVTLPASVNSCQVNPFLLCKKLETVTIRNEGDFMPMHTDGQYPMFAGCDNLKTIRVAWEKGAVVGAPWGAPDGVEILYKGEWDDN